MFLTITSQEIIITIALFIISYLIGSIPFGLIIGLKVKKIDIRQHGSKNIGATNSIRVLGKPLGLFIFTLDVLKGATTIILVKYILQPLDLYHFIFPDFLILLGVVSVLGHVLPVFLKFKGGKAVASSLGVVFSLTPISAIACLIIFLIVIYSTGYVSLGSTFAAFTVFGTTLLLNIYGSTEYILLFHKPGNVVVITYGIMVLLIMYKHKKNYIKLLNGTENNFKKNKKTR